MIPQTWIIECLKMSIISEKVENFIMEAIENWKVELAAGWQNLTVVKIKRGIVQGDSVSPLLFVIAMVLLIYILRICIGGY